MTHLPNTRLPGALVLSLDFELHWGWRDRVQGESEYMRNFHGVWQAAPAMLELFERFDVAATWATVGMLFAENQRELLEFSPAVRPTYQQECLDPYQEPLGHGQDDDPLHFAPSLVQAIQAARRQELASHTFSHYYCQAEGQTREQFAADLASAVAIGRRRGAELRSIVFPRNQVNPDYNQVLLEHGVHCYRGNQPWWMYQSTGPAARAARLADSHLNLFGHHTQRWDEILEPSGLANVRAGYFLRPCARAESRLARQRRRRIQNAMSFAAQRGEVVHLWWHPHNFGTDLAENIASLTHILQHYARLRDSFGMQSLSMGETADRAGEYFGSRQATAAAA